MISALLNKWRVGVAFYKPSFVHSFETTMTDSQPQIEELSLASQGSLSQSRDDDDSFLCRIDKSQILQAFLQHLQYKKNQTTIVNVCAKTLRFVIEESRVWQASLSLGETIFSEYRASDTVNPFKVPLSVLLDSLNVYGPSSNSMLLMDYRGYGQPLKITSVGSSFSSTPSNPFLNFLLVD